MRGRVLAVGAAVVAVALTLLWLAFDAGEAPRDAGARDPAADIGPAPRTGTADEPAAPSATRPPRVRARRPSDPADASAADAADVGHVVCLVSRAETGAPLVGATVRWWVEVSPPGRVPVTWVVDDAVLPPPEGAGTTDAAGLFAFDPSDGTPRRVVATAPGRAPAASTVCGDRLVSLELSAAASLAVRVRDAHSQSPIAGAVLRLWDEDVAGPPVASATSDSAGCATLGVRDGQIVVASARGHAPVAVAVVVSEYPCEIDLPRAAGVAGVVVDDEGRAIAGATVVVAGGLDPLDLAATTDAAGAFDVPGDRTRVRSLSASAPGHVAAQLGRVGAEGDIRIVLPREAFVEGDVVDPDGRPVTRYAIEPGEDLADGRFRVGPVAPGVVRFEVRTVDAAAQEIVVVRAGETLRDHRVVLAPAREASCFRFVVEGPASARDVDGRLVLRTPGGWELTSVAVDLAGTSHVRAWTSGVDRAVATLTWRGDAALVADPRVEVRAANDPDHGPETTLRVREARRVALRLVDEGGAAVAFESDAIDVDGDGDGADDADDADGSLLLAEGARFRLRVRVPGFVAHDAEHTAAEATAGVLVVHLRSGVVVRGRLVAPTDAVVAPQLWVRAGPGADAWPACLVQMSAAGRFVLAGVAPDASVLVVREDDDVVVLRRPLAVPDGATEIDLGDVPLPVQATIAGRVTGAGASVSRVQVGLQGDLRDAWGGGADGTFEFEVPDGSRAVLVAAGAGFAAPPVELTARVGTAPVELRVAPSGRVLVRAPYPSDEDVVVRCRLAGGPEWEADVTRWGDAAFTVDDLPPGRVDLRITSAGRERRRTATVVAGEVAEIVLEP